MLKRLNSFCSDDTAEKESLPVKCRVCLKNGDIPIFGRDDISKEIKEFGGIEVVKNDFLPKHICDACHTLLEAAVLFRKTAQNSELIIMDTNFLEESSYDLSDDPEYSRVVNKLIKTEDEPYVKREYIEYVNSFGSDDDGQFSKTEETSEYDEDGTDVRSLKNYDSKLDPVNETVMIIVSDKIKSKPLPTGCEKCNQTFMSHKELKIHNAEKHPPILKYQKECDVCKKIVSKSDYMTHLTEHREKYKRKHEKKYGKVECKICGKKVMKTYFNHHLKMHGSETEKSERVKQCPICEKLVTVGYLSAHMKRVHQTSTLEKPVNKNDKLYKICPVCDRKVDKNNYKTHLARHGGPTKQYVCDQCGKVFKYPSPFKTHCLTHGGELKYQCQFCPYRGLHQALLKIHMRTHTGDYNYKCMQCPARFLTKSNLSKHLARHNGAYKVICEICNKGFYTQRELDKHHLNTHTDIRDNICEICGKGFAHKDALHNHQLKTHKRPKFCERRGRMPSYLRMEETKGLDEDF